MPAVATGFGLFCEPALCAPIEVYSEISRTAGVTLILVCQALAA